LLLDSEYRIRCEGYIQRNNVHKKFPENRSSLSRTEMTELPMHQNVPPHSVKHMRASVQAGVYLKFIVFLLHSVVNLTLSAGVREIGYLDHNRTASCTHSEKHNNNNV
jgi:hypothetical protein